MVIQTLLPVDMQPHVKYELKELESLVSSQQLNTIEAPQLDQIFKKEIERVKQTFVHEVFTFEDERHLERYIQYHQQALIRIMDKMAIGLNSEETAASSPVDTYRICYDGLEDLLSFVERHFTKYFDQDASAPQGYIAIARKDAKLNLKKLQKILTGKNADPRVIELMMHILKKVIHDNPDHGITYRKVMYAKEVQKELFILLDRCAITVDMDEELRQIMYYLNYNSSKVLTYHAHYISALLDQAETRAEKIEKLSFILKKINQAQVKPGIRYHQNGPSLKEQLNIYISEEIDYQERLQQLSTNTPRNPPDPFLPGFQLKFEASVAQLAYLLRILIETKTLLNNNLSQVIHFLVKYVVTKRSEAISYGSFRSKFYATEINTKESVRSMLVYWIEYIDKS